MAQSTKSTSAKKSTTAKKTAEQAATSNTAKRTSTSKDTTTASERDVKVLATDAAYAIAGLAGDAVRLANEAGKAARRLPEKAQDLRDLPARRKELDKLIATLREQAGKRFDEKSAEGRTVTDEVLKDDRVKRVLDQAHNARSQVKAAITSIRKTADGSVQAGVSAGKKQAETARRQTKAAATSIQKTVEAGRVLVGASAEGDGDS